MPDHSSHTKERSRINRAVGQLQGIKRMIEKEQYCVDILSQLRAVRNAIKSIELSVLKTHIMGCIADGFCSQDEARKVERIHEIMELLKKYE
ncbi:metal-sensitive transcriptional regulator [Legionella maioricensis]|uniref:Metal-sensitive transcriptional regulator n=1 Tax=Legionella maioricensis TaxID=2896528 RepID=A0A9X2CY42_9GAMM|nr:metal-sensitive transcriptional regulator [Legionella maioricensis]MCL9682886.1 metal-sensitive transcriptional regulator [Legionella maioricensis]MCL9686486.1 metal-sensitive transcriptional regulator [Legionella maioricensis]